MYIKIRKSTYALSLAAIIFMNLIGCGSDNESDSANTSMHGNNVSAVDSENSSGKENTDEELSYDTRIESVLENSDAQGYTICKIDGSDAYHLVLLFGDPKKEHNYDFYTITEDSVENIGSLDGLNITAYISEETSNMCICMKDSEKYEFGAVKYDGEAIFVDWIETVIPDKKGDYVDIPGKEIVFMKTDDYQLIGKLIDKLPKNSASANEEAEE